MIYVYFKKNPDFQDFKKDQVYTLEDYDCIAKVNTDSLKEAFELTQNISSPWSTRSYKVTLFPYSPHNYRSSSIGDIFEKGGLFGVQGVGFVSLGLSPTNMHIS